MNFRYLFASILILAIIFSFGTVVANENVHCNISSDDAYSAIDISSQDILSASDDNSYNAQESISGLDAIYEDDCGAVSSLDDCDDVQNFAADEFNQNICSKKSVMMESSSGSSSADGVDLSVNMGLGDIRRYSTGFNQVVFDIPLVISVLVENGTSYGTQLKTVIPSEFEYVSHNASVGVYNASTGLWDIGDMDNSSDASLTILTRLIEKGTYLISVNATTGSNDLDLSNNDLICAINVSSKITSNTTRTSDDNDRPQHSEHQASSSFSGSLVLNGRDTTKSHDIAYPSINGESSSGGGSNGGGSNGGGSSSSSGGDGSGSSGSSNNEGSSSSSGGASSSGGSSGSSDGSFISDSEFNGYEGYGSTIKKINSNIFTGTVNSLSSTISDIFNIEDSSNDKDVNGSLETFGAAYVYDYTQIPILIFCIFLVAFVGVLGYDKIKS